MDYSIVISGFMFLLTLNKFFSSYFQGVLFPTKLFVDVESD